MQRGQAMILNGPRLLIKPDRVWHDTVGTALRPAPWLVAAALTAAVWPAVAVVLGHVGSALVGHEELSVATLRAAIGFISVLGGALVMAPALTLALLWTTNNAHTSTTVSQAGPVAMGLLWPTWTAGIVLAFPPLLGFGPTVGEILWMLLGTLVAFRTIRSGAVSSLRIRRRWRWRFTIRSVLAFVLIFVMTSLGPAVAVRGILNISKPAGFAMPDRPALPRPPDSEW